MLIPLDSDRRQWRYKSGHPRAQQRDEAKAMVETTPSEHPSPWLVSLLLLLCGDVERNPGPSKPTGDGAAVPRSGSSPGMPTSRSRLSLASMRSVIEKRRREQYIEPSPLWCSCRIVLALMGFWGFLNVYSMRVNLSVAMVCMINHTAIHAATTAADAAGALGTAGDHGHNVTAISVNATAVGSKDDSGWNVSGVGVGDDNRMDADGGEGDEDEGRCGTLSGNSSLSREDGEFSWSKETQGLILGSFFWGYMITQIPGGWLSARFGGKRVYGWFMFGCAVCTLLMPLAARTDYRFLLVLRFLAGIGQGVTFPAMNVLWANWAPPLESSKLGSIGYSGSQVGNVLTFPVAGVLCEYGIDGGWPSIFYLLGSLGLLWFAIWCILVYDSPAEHPRISSQEREYITASLQGKMSAVREGSIHVPWRVLLTSRPVWGIIITHTCSNFGTYTFLTNIPTYLKEVLHFDIKQNGLLSALPYIGFWLAIIASGQLADFARSRGYLNTTQARKLGNSLGMLLPGTFVAAVGYMTCEQSTTAVVLLTLGVACSGFQYGSGWMVNPVDIAPRYAGVIFGLSNTMATIPGFLAPMAIGHITKHQTQAEWQIVFFIATAIYTVGALAYIILGSGEIQPWAKQDPPPSNDPQDPQKTVPDDSRVEDPLLKDPASLPASEKGKPTSRVSFRKNPDVDQDMADGGKQSSADSPGGVRFF